jgi:hypothetical protein
MAIRTIEHPNVEITELDLSQYTPGLAMTTTLTMGFTERGEELVPQIITSKNAFINYYGAPKTDAERYSLAAAEEVFKENGTLIFARLPYDNVSTGRYRYIKGSLIDDVKINRDNRASLGLVSGADEIWETAESLFSVSEPVTGAGFKRIEIDTLPSILTTSEFDELRTANEFPQGKRSTDKTNFIVVNKTRDVLFGKDQNAGMFIVITPIYNSLGFRSNASVPSGGGHNWQLFNGINAPQLGATPSAWTAFEEIDSTGNVKYRNNHFALSPLGTTNGKSWSKNFALTFPKIQRDGSSIDPTHVGDISISVVKSYFGENYEDKLELLVLETFTGSLDRRATDSRGRSRFIGDAVNSNSNFIEFYMEVGTDPDYFARASDQSIYTVVDSNYIDQGAGTLTWPLLSFSEAESLKTINYSLAMNSIDTVFEKVKNIDEYEIDLVVDSGLSTVLLHVENTKGEDGKSEYTPEIWDPDNEIRVQSDVDIWRSVCEKFIEFCQFTRRDCFAILDAPRSLVLKGNSKLIRSTNSDFIFDVEIIPKFRFLSGLNTNYAAMYITWVKIIDQYTNKIVWLPQSTKAIGAYNYVDRVLNIFDAPAGLNNAIISVNDIAFNPTNEQADQIYINNFNYAKKWPLQGYTIEGQKTLQNKNSAFDRVNVRRMFLRIERLFRKVALYYLYRPNNFVTRVQLYDTLSPILEQMKAAGGIQEYLLIINEQNNTPEVIDNNELKIAVFIKPTKIAEFIRATFIATNQGVVLEELQEAILPQL